MGSFLRGEEGVKAPPGDAGELGTAINYLLHPWASARGRSRIGPSRHSELTLSGAHVR